MNKHTPGPWHVDTSSISQFNIVDSNLFVVCDTICGEEKSDEVNEANAKLIAAAPEMLKVLEAMLSRFQNIDTEFLRSEHVKNLARLAISKAKGELS